MKAEILQPFLPENLAQAVSGYVWRQDNIGFSSARIFHLMAENKKSLYLKVDSRAFSHSLLKEKVKLEWLKNRLPVPEVLLFTADENNEYLLLSEISGLPSSDDSLKTDTPHVIEQLVNGLKMIHSLPIEDCPFKTGLDYKIEFARERMIKGLVEEEDFDDERQGRTAEDLFDELLAVKPTDEDLVFTHGDYCAPNIILKNGKLSGFVDWAIAGIADRYQDIALLTRSVRYNFGEEYEESVFEIYNIKPDWKKIHFYRLLDEFF
ncbi:MAG TPA: APH(3') family aminoglycoside O-phosphotransferase [Pyrinomonadaceae bacterium]|nr:APH(3') family aminoglycoside O-phosphotransferase [Pyrinomonadaceae bacterium]